MKVGLTKGAEDGENPAAEGGRDESSLTRGELEGSTLAVETETLRAKEEDIVKRVCEL